MKTLILATQKGGAGKTTLAAHLAVAAEAAGAGPVALLDMDRQGSLAAWWNGRDASTPAFINASLATVGKVLTDLPNAGFRLAIIDTPPVDHEGMASLLKAGSLVLIPIKPSPHDLRAAGATVERVQEAERPFAFVLNMVKPNARLTAEAAAALSEHGPVAPSMIGDRVDFAGAMIDGRTVLELDPKGRSSGEVGALWKYVEKRINGKTK